MFEKIDFQILKYIYLQRPHFADKCLLWATENTTYITISILLVILLIAIIKNKKQFYNKFFIVLASIITAAVVTNLLKLFIQRPRPYDIYPIIQIPHIDAGGYSFPSGHTTEVFALAISLYLVFRNIKWIPMFFIWAALIAYSRMAFGVHYPLDVLFGIFIGTLTSLLVYKIYYHFTVKK